MKLLSLPDVADRDINMGMVLTHFVLKKVFLINELTYLCVWVCYLHVCLCTMSMPGTWGGQKRTSGSRVTGDCELPFRQS